MKFRITKIPYKTLYEGSYMNMLKIFILNVSFVD